MATETVDSLTIQESDELEAAIRVRAISASSTIAKFLMPLASLRLTVVLFALAIFLIFAGTLAQANQDIWEVMNQYFRAVIAWIDLQVFFPKAFFAGDPPHVPGSFPFPGGFAIGAAMGVNLLAAHALRFKAQARGPRLVAGLGVITLGVVLTWMVVLGGSGKETIEGVASFEWSVLWNVMKWSLLAVWAAGIYAVVKLDRKRPVERWTLIVFELVVGAVLFWIFLNGNDAALGDSSMRILWQLIKGGLAGLILLAGCILVFRKRAGIVLLHAGVALVMANELVVYGLHVEGQMQIKEGETVDYVYDIRAIELSLVDTSDPKSDDVVVVPGTLLKTKELIDDEQLPCDVQTVEYLQNSSLHDVKTGQENRATAGTGLNTIAETRRAGTGTDAGGSVDVTSAYVKLIDKKSHQDIGTYLVSAGLKPQKVEIDGKNYELALRFKRTYKPYAMKLHDVRFDKYLGTETAKNYSSDLRLVDASRNVDRDVKIWMNNPLRFAGETFYQSSYFLDGNREGTILQVVTNTGWMIPYVACMLVGTGMLAQFSVTLLRFLKRRSDAEASEIKPLSRKKLARAASRAQGGRWSGWYFPGAVVLCSAVWIASMARMPQTPINEMQIEEFGRLPVVYEGRVKPFDTVARNMLRYLSGKQTFLDETGKAPKKGQPAIKWFLDVIARPDLARKHKIFRIENLDVLETMGLKRREGFRYSIAEFGPKIDEMERQARLALELEPGKASVYQKKLIELYKKYRLVELVGLSFDPPQLRPDHAEEDLKMAMRQLAALSRMQAPLAVPPDAVDGQWETFTAAWFNGLKDHVRGLQPSPAMVDMTSMIVAYSKDDAKTFNSELAKYQVWLADHKPEGYNGKKVAYEEFFNVFEPFYGALLLYPVAFVLVALGWLGWTSTFNRAAFWLIVLALCVHTFALASRVYISGRPPVINLYSTAVFIGWGGVILGLILEMVYRLGIGIVIASIAGFATLLIANFLAAMNDGDTLGVLQAVLDTQFWLATHVVCINLGYATTYIAGLLGALYILRGVFTPSLSSDVSKDLGRMIYGSVCFAMFFSFVGTVLGGLWADDSWGRFWGWDPKENGALMIVLWNALVLHARWGGMVKERGVAALAVVGNVVTSWSYFGVNELGVGLHSYGFTEGVLLALGIFSLSQLAIVALAAMPKHLWWSFRATPAA
jgi:ABC-type transport system involved in cytochrome c biogenesis permease subunit